MISSSINLSFLLRASIFFPQRRLMSRRNRTHGIDHGNYLAPYTMSNFEKPPIWADLKYKRRFLGQIAPKRTARNCYTSEGSKKKKRQCAVCDNNSSFTYKDIEFIENFICPVTNELIHEGLTGVCRYQQKRLRQEIFLARMLGLLKFNLPNPGLEIAKALNLPK